ncbi:hypothetical protein [Ralstonia mannitolilytica]|uniref:hypothetical protein n=1 Tax=Ralstonia mannitolilytica TaxID=105219 RepID=UPI0029314E34|nr:hypothetical protein [Ralstonia mannitolilytica]
MYWLRTVNEAYELAVEREGEQNARVITSELACAVTAARDAGWRSVIVGDPYMFVVPADEVYRFGYVWATPAEDRPMVVVSPIPLPWLERHEVSALEACTCSCVGR